jgi:ribonuclease T2
VLAVSWQAGFCASKPGKPECEYLSDETYASTHFTLHGLWPNKDVCGTKYDFCGKVQNEAATMCQFPEVTLSPEVEGALAMVMPSEKYHSCLERHEWWKHGTCRDDTPNAYYMLATALVKMLNESTFVNDFIMKNIGRNVYKSNFYAAFDKAFAAGASNHVLLRCYQSALTELQINLPKVVDATQKMETLIHAGPEETQEDSCGESFFLLEPRRHP